MFKAYASSETPVKDEEEKKPIVAPSSSSNNSANSTWLENKSFAVEPPIVTLQKQSTISTKPSSSVDVKPKEEKKPISKPIQTIFIKKNENDKFVFNFLFIVLIYYI